MITLISITSYKQTYVRIVGFLKVPFVLFNGDKLYKANQLFWTFHLKS